MKVIDQLFKAGSAFIVDSTAGDYLLDRTAGWAGWMEGWSWAGVGGLYFLYSWSSKPIAGPVNLPL